MAILGLYRLVVGIVLFKAIVCPPVNHEPEPPVPKEGGDPVDENYMKLEYKKYLEEVVEVLETDEDFKKKLEEQGDKANMEGGQIAHYLQFANQNTRTKLDEIKRIEIRRIKDLHRKLKHEMEGSPPVDLGHIDHENPHTFEIEDLKKLILKTTSDLAGLDKKREQEFKQYEINKEHEYREKLKHAEKEEAERLQREHEEAKKRHGEHPKVHEPGHKEQLEEVWEEGDHMESQPFDPKVFFMLHDIDSDGYLNPAEIEALFIKELDKVYNASNPDDDMVERNEEMNKMRQHVFNEIDKDKDSMISYEEFLQSTKSEDFEKDESWETLDEEKIYTDEELLAYEKELAEQEQKLNHATATAHVAGGA